MKPSQNLTNYIKDSASQKNEYNLFGKVVFVKDPLPEPISLNDVFAKIEALIPAFLFYNVDIIYIGDFGIFKEKNVNALYSDGAMYLTNDQDNLDDMVDDIVHELAHAVEEQYGSDIFGDGQIKKEFLAKRRWLERNLRHQGFDTSSHDFAKIEFDDQFDNYLFWKIGYPYINSHFSGKAFVNAYSITSLREYFAVGFEKYYLGDRDYLSKICPKLYQKLIEIDSMGD
jgi:hypothetical protein